MLLVNTVSAGIIRYIVGYRDQNQQPQHLSKSFYISNPDQRYIYNNIGRWSHAQYHTALSSSGGEIKVWTAETAPSRAAAQDLMDTMKHLVAIHAGSGLLIAMS